MMAGLTKFSPGSINHTCPPWGGATTRGPRRLCQQISHSQVSFLQLHQYKDEMMERGSDGFRRRQKLNDERVWREWEQESTAREPGEEEKERGTIYLRNYRTVQWRTKAKNKKSTSRGTQGATWIGQGGTSESFEAVVTQNSVFMKKKNKKHVFHYQYCCEIPTWN